MRTFAESLQLALPQAKKDYPQLFRDLDEEQLSRYLTCDNYLEIFGCDLQIRYGLPSVLCHGDLQPLNVMFEKKPSAEREDGDRVIALIDWQTAHIGCGAEDLASLLAWFIRPEAKKEMGDQIIKRYVKLFNEKVRKEDHKIQFENLKRAVEELFAFAGMIFGCGITGNVSWAGSFTGVTEAERESMKNDMTTRATVHFLDAIDILGWSAKL